MKRSADSLSAITENKRKESVRNELATNEQGGRQNGVWTLKPSHQHFLLREWIEFMAVFKRRQLQYTHSLICIY